MSGGETRGQRGGLLLKLPRLRFRRPLLKSSPHSSDHPHLHTSSAHTARSRAPLRALSNAPPRGGGGTPGGANRSGIEKRALLHRNECSSVTLSANCRSFLETSALFSPFGKGQGFPRSCQFYLPPPIKDSSDNSVYLAVN